MSTIDLTKADDKDAKLTLKLRAKSGYSSDETHEISARQWSEISAICVNGDKRREMRAASDLLDALRLLLNDYITVAEEAGCKLIGSHADPEVVRARTAIAKATGA